VGASQEEIDATVGKGVKQPDLQRLIVFMRGSSVVRVREENEAYETPCKSEVIFGRMEQVQNHIVIPSGMRFVAAKGPSANDDCLELARIKPGEVVI
jgi:hypothetical protein